MLLTITESWQSLELIEKIYWCIAVPFSVLFVLQIILTFFGGDIDDIEADGDSDVSVDSDHGIDFQFITLKNLVAFFTIFGWAGVACLDGGLSVGKSVLISSISGLVMMSIMASIVYFMGKLTDNGTLNMNNAIGKVGSVYLPIPAKRDGFGKVQIKVQGLQTLDAMTDYDEEIKTGAVVEVIEILNNEILVVKPSSK
ncbi:MAG: serine protease [Bacteroidales bacterium]|nr:serine protease [Bacteroidales bacterium]